MTSPAHTKGILAGIKRRLFSSTPRTPYDWPPTAARGPRNTTNVNERGTDGRISKFVESVSSLIARIAFKFFTFVCRKRLTVHLNASGSSKKLSVKLDVPTVNLVEQRLTEANSLSTSKDNGISDIEKQIIHRRIERAKVIHLLKMINSQSSKIHNSELENKPKKVLKRDHTFIDDDEPLLCRPHKIQKKLVEKEKQAVDNISFTTFAMEGAIATNDMNDAFTSSISSSLFIKSTNTTASCHTTLPLQRNSGAEFIDQDQEIDQDEMVVENAPFTTPISEDVIVTNGMNDTSYLNRRSIISSTNVPISSHVALPSQRKPSFHMPVREVLKRGRSFLNDEEPLLCPPRKIHKKLGEKEKQVADNIPFTTIAIEGAIAANDMNDAFTSSRNSSTIINSTNSTASCHATLPSQRKPSFHMLTPEFLDIDEENDETNI